MTAVELGGLVYGATLATTLGAGAWCAIRGGALRHASVHCFVCPRYDTPVACRAVQDVRTGQWKQVEACSAFLDAAEIACERDCMRRLNLGFGLRLPGRQGLTLL